MIKKNFNLSKLFVGAFFIIQIISASAVLAFAIPSAKAEVTYESEPLNFTPQVSIPGSKFVGQEPIAAGSYNNKTGNMTSNLMASYIISFYNYGLAISGILATLVLMGAGVIWLTSGGDSGKISQAKELISGAVVGLIILVCAWMILNTINPNLTKLSNLEVSVVKKEEKGFIKCCSPTNGETVVVTDIKDGKKVFASGENKGKAIKCADGYKECKENESCSVSGANSTFSCIDTANYNCCEYDKDYEIGTVFCAPVLKSSTCPNASSIKNPSNKFDTFTFEERLDLYCSSGINSSCSDTKKNLGESCGNEGGRCFKSGCPENYEQDAGGKSCRSGQWCCMPLEDGRAEGDCTGNSDGSYCANTSDYCYNQKCLKGDGKENERCGVQPGAICKRSANVIKSPNNPHDERDSGDGGRDCDSGLYCYYSVNRECGTNPGAKCFDVGLFGICPDGFKYSSGGGDCPGTNNRCCYPLK